ncbi:hypothetical protein MKW98_024304 [Papaver atlanticum]|uniref:Uncharacterized protein n=1 Tax=Papaver atlanticum TaxID=357466 RepID=A0AAD4XNI9_9MAGN|nr:hypothetical protein MKW98_024304 [Papaver atlanticum]
MTSCIRGNCVIRAPQQRTLQEKIRNMHDPTKTELYKGLVTEERGLKKSRNSLGGASTSHSQPSPRSKETNFEEEVHSVVTSQRGGGGRGRGGRRDGPRTRGGGSTNKRGRNGRRG